ncbi:hypothetical protein HN748_02280, partial [Candidatus Peregrinibacteria bacterium]|nr:hypothetical protein [Candidatus Peregrinibacteria bacterium]
MVGRPPEDSGTTTPLDTAEEQAAYEAVINCLLGERKIPGAPAAVVEMRNIIAVQILGGEGEWVRNNQLEREPSRQFKEKKESTIQVYISKAFRGLRESSLNPALDINPPTGSLTNRGHPVAKIESARVNPRLLEFLGDEEAIKASIHPDLHQVLDRILTRLKDALGAQKPVSEQPLQGDEIDVYGETMALKIAANRAHWERISGMRREFQDLSPQIRHRLCYNYLVGKMTGKYASTSLKMALSLSQLLARDSADLTTEELLEVFKESREKEKKLKKSILKTRYFKMRQAVPDVKDLVFSLGNRSGRQQINAHVAGEILTEILKIHSTGTIGAALSQSPPPASPQPDLGPTEYVPPAASSAVPPATPPATPPVDPAAREQLELASANWAQIEPLRQRFLAIPTAERQELCERFFQSLGGTGLRAAPNLARIITNILSQGEAAFNDEDFLVVMLREGEKIESVTPAALRQRLFRARKQLPQALKETIVSFPVPDYTVLKAPEIERVLVQILNFHQDPFMDEYQPVLSGSTDKPSVRIVPDPAPPKNPIPKEKAALLVAWEAIEPLRRAWAELPIPEQEARCQKLLDDSASKGSKHNSITRQLLAHTLRAQRPFVRAAEWNKCIASSGEDSDFLALGRRRLAERETINGALGTVLGGNERLLEVVAYEQKGFTAISPANASLIIEAALKLSMDGYELPASPFKNRGKKKEPKRSARATSSSSPPPQGAVVIKIPLLASYPGAHPNDPRPQEKSHARTMGALGDGRAP